ncbi:cytochrome c maturation protein CcmE [Thiohalobacter sp.]|uniref:cytochrome c maturation protein CcmE n=1 Tax=Thiohalobacter sp. TaxID=2025948 RepID=UPI0026269615|nr:cytochrome c maturation protein CcmE [Thiohalobacter sp.]
MTPARRNRLLLALAVVTGVGVAVALALKAFQSNLMFFYSPTEVAAGKVPANAVIRVGGLVVPGSIQRERDSLTVRFVVTDNQARVPVEYTGILPDLFREGQGIIARGRLAGGRVVADEVLARHDENYMPPEVAESLHPVPPEVPRP